MARTSDEPVRYGVIGLGHISQAALLPAFQNAENSVLTALISDDDQKLKVLGDRYNISERCHYDDLEDLLDRDVVDAVYIGLPNHLHHEFTLRAAKKGVHVLCEKPLAVTSQECREMIEACDDNGVFLMTAYRLHFEPANMRAAQIAAGNELGELRFFESAFTQEVVGENIRLNPVDQGGGSLFDMGTYCINAARYLFKDEPTEVTAFAESLEGDERFTDSDEMMSVVMRFPNNRIASFISSLGSSQLSYFRLVGTKGDLTLRGAYKYATDTTLELKIGDDKSEEHFESRDQFGPELVYFSECIRQNRRPEPDGQEGLIDVQIIEACHESVRTGRAVQLDLPNANDRPDVDQVILRPHFEKPPEVKASSPKENP